MKRKTVFYKAFRNKNIVFIGYKNKVKDSARLIDIQIKIRYSIKKIPF